jgi:cytochrome P450
MWRRADRQIDEFAARGECEHVGDFAGPFTLYVIADLLGVPERRSRDVSRKSCRVATIPSGRSAAPGWARW